MSNNRQRVNMPSPYPYHPPGPRPGPSPPGPRPGPYPPGPRPGPYPPGPRPGPYPPRPYPPGPYPPGPYPPRPYPYPYIYPQPYYPVQFVTYCIFVNPADYNAVYSNLLAHGVIIINYDYNTGRLCFRTTDTIYRSYISPYYTVI